MKSGCAQRRRRFWRQVKENVKKSITKIKNKFVPWKPRKMKWHSREWNEKKKKLRKELRKEKL